MSYYSVEQDRIYLHAEESLRLWEACFYEDPDDEGVFTERIEWREIGTEVGAISASIIAWWFYNTTGTRASNAAEMKRSLPAKDLTTWSYNKDEIFQAIDYLNDYLGDLMYDLDHGKYHGHQLLHDYRKCCAVNLIEVLTWIMDGGSWNHRESGWHRNVAIIPELPCDPTYFTKLWKVAGDMAAVRGEPL